MGNHPDKIAMSAQKKDIVNDYTPDGRVWTGDGDVNPES